MKPHRFAPASLIFGLAFAGIGLVFLAGDVDVWGLDWSWVWPIVLTLAGLAVLFSARSSGTHRADNAEPAPESPPPSDPFDPLAL